jgi:hypothetical protein
MHGLHPRRLEGEIQHQTRFDFGKGTNDSQTTEGDEDAMSTENLSLLPPEQLPQTDEPKKVEKVNCLQDQLLDLMNERGVSLAEIQASTGIPWGTLMAWHDGKFGSQLADKNLLRLAQFFKVPLEFLVYGLGSDEPLFEEFNNDETA